MKEIVIVDMKILKKDSRETTGPEIKRLTFHGMSHFKSQNCFESEIPGSLDVPRIR